ncbi:MAG: methyltransferase domain-containing protein, partial [Bacteroidetes bacterium]|nr:methyltransferase domain-containing protein [Bacteroidota bacterium]
FVIFAEGTGPSDGGRRRLHTGAFDVAEKLGLDILPVILHGTGYTKSKGDLLLKDGTTTVEFLPRINPENKNFGATYSERTKLINRYVRQEYEIIREKIEQPKYFKEQLVRNYLYKGPVLEWYTRIKIKLENYYQQFHELIPKEGRILDIGCGYGFMSYMLSLTSPKRMITGVDYDEEKIATASNCFSKNENLNFEYRDILGFQFEKYDAIIISDVLHYLQPNEQKIVIEKCIDSLKENGLLVIRDGDKDLAERHKGTKLTEFFSTRLFSFNKTSKQGLSFLSGTFIQEMADKNKMELSRIDNTKRTSNIIFVLKKIHNTVYAGV